MIFPYFSCIVTAFTEGASVRCSIESLLNQTFENFEIVLVQDGVDDLTKQIISEFTDPRLKVIPQSNDGLSSARNRALRHCKGEYVLFLDADDMRPPWAFQHIYDLTMNKPDCVFGLGKLVELRGEVLDFYDTSIWNEIRSNVRRPLLYLTEPQSANKAVRRDFINQYKLCFPNGLFFEDMLFHIGVIANMDSFEVTTLPVFTYFRRYGRPQITSGAGTNRFDAISTSFMTLRYYLEAAGKNKDKEELVALLMSLFKLISWCESSISHTHRWHYRSAVNAELAMFDDEILILLKDVDLRNEFHKYPWYKSVSDYINSLEVLV